MSYCNICKQYQPCICDPNCVSFGVWNAGIFETMFVGKRDECMLAARSYVTANSGEYCRAHQNSDTGQIMLVAGAYRALLTMARA